MPGAKRTEGPQHISQGDRAYPGKLGGRLDADAPKSIAVVGSSQLLSSPMTAFLCSKETPGATILKAFDQAAAWRDAGRCVISGFHSQLEKECLDILLRGRQPVVIALARRLTSLRLPPPHRMALEDGRLTIVSPFSAEEKRTTLASARMRNRFVAALAEEVVFAFIAPGGSLVNLAEEVRSWGMKSNVLHQ